MLISYIFYVLYMLKIPILYFVIRIGDQTIIIFFLGKISRNEFKHGEKSFPKKLFFIVIYNRKKTHFISTTIKNLKIP